MPLEGCVDPLTGGEDKMGSQSLRQQTSRGLRVGSVIAISTAVVLGVIYLVTRATDVPFSDLTRDAAATLEGPWYTGSLSNLTNALAIAGAAIALFAASLLPRSEGRSIRGLLIALGLLVIVVSVDDLLMLHEMVFPEIGLSATVVFALYGVAIVAILWLWRRVILDATDYAYLALSAVALGISVVVDVTLEQGLFELPFSGELVEDPAKILGMVFMTFYLIVTSRRALAGQRESASPDRG